MRFFPQFRVLAAFATLAAFASTAKAAQHASGGGTYFVEPGVRSQFEFNHAMVQCKIGHAVLPGDIQFFMFMASTGIGSVSIDSATKTVTITGSMVSIVVLRFPDGSSVTLNESVPFTAVGDDNGEPGKGVDTFSLKVTYTATAGFDQADLFGTSATFAGTLDTGNVVVR